MIPYKLPLLITLGIVTNIIASLALVQAHPTWQSFNSRSSIDSLITGSTFLLAGGLEYGIPYYLTTSGARDSTGNMTISFIPRRDDALLFFVNNGQLFHNKNESYILHVNVLNTTSDTDEPLPYKLALGRQRDGLRDAMWRWWGTFLHLGLGLGHGQRANRGLYYKCVTKHGEGVYTSFEP
ncbi:hypothetical protein BJV78DRAFT_1279857 [Lactifluus subvellereus]|nr:hypothetical protein BJV78DRAFT_1279857 [Lactifluus subvellereus]